jgi:hypothetical protein
MFRSIAEESEQCIRPGCAGTVDWHTIHLTAAELGRFGLVHHADPDQHIREGTCPRCGDRYRIAPSAP